MKRRFATWAIVFAAAVATMAGERIQTAGAAAILGLDHIPIAVGNLERAADRFRALGFVLKPGRPHANGIRNEHAKFPDGTELELITAPAARDDLTRKYRRHLAAGDGPAFLAFYAPDQSRVTRPLPPYVFLGGRQRSPTRIAQCEAQHAMKFILGLESYSHADLTLRGRPNSIADEVQQNLPQASGITLHRFRHVRGDVA